MKVLIVNTSERTGGAAVAASRLIEALNNNGVKAKTLLFDGGYVSLDFIRPFLAMPKLKLASLWSFGLTKTLTKTGTGSNATYTPTYHFYMKDHLGSNRVVASTTGEAEQVNHYYPYGSTFYGETSTDHRFKYCGKELDRMHGLDWYDSGIIKTFRKYHDNSTLRTNKPYSNIWIMGRL